MPGSNKFSIYPNQSAKILLNIFYWVVLYFFMLLINGVSFKAGTFSSINVLFSCMIMFTIILIHYFLSYFTFVYIRKRKWGIVLITFLVVYLFSIIGRTVFIKVLKELYPESDVISSMYQRFKGDNFSKIVSFNSILWVLTFTIWYTIPGITIKIIIDSYESLQEKSAIIKEKNTMELNFLRTQIQPHFLFNALNSIYGLVIDNEAASQAVLQLSNLLRFSVHGSKKNDITLQEEIVFLTNYILLEKIRQKESRVQINYNFEKIENKEIFIKPLILINFIENAFKHGINASIKKMWVNIIMAEEGGLLTFQIANNKPEINATSSMVDIKRAGIGLSNVQRRLELEYQDCYSLDVKETEDIFEVVLVIKLH